MAKEYGVSDLGVFGSIARGEAEEGSDVDILVTLDRPIGLIRFVGLEQEIEELLGVEVDLTTREGLKPWMRDRGSSMPTGTWTGNSCGKPSPRRFPACDPN